MKINTKRQDIDIKALEKIINDLFKDYGKENINKAKNFIDKNFHINKIDIEIDMNDISFLFIQQLRSLLDLLPVAHPTKDNNSLVYSSSYRTYGENMDSRAILTELGYIDSVSTMIFDIDCKTKEISLHAQNNDNSDKIVAIPFISSQIKDQNGISPVEKGELFSNAFITYLLPNEVLCETFKITKEFHKGLKRYFGFMRRELENEKKIIISFFTYYNDDHKKILSEVYQKYKEMYEEGKYSDYKVSTSEKIDEDLYKEEIDYISSMFLELSKQI